MSGIVIVGAGECGVRAAFALREAGYGGAVRLVGDEPHLPYERPPLSKRHPVAPKIIAAQSAFSEAGIELSRGRRATAIAPADRRVTLADGSSLSYDRLLLATGCRPRLFPGMEAAKTLRTLDDAAEILGRIGAGTGLVIIGGGFIGMELAAVASVLGADVTVLEVADRLMARAVPEEIARVVEARHRREGVKILLGARVELIAADHVALSGGTDIPCDMVVAGVGAVPNTALAEAAGLAVDNGIVVDERFRTADDGVYAAGDCCSFLYRNRRVRLESWRAAQDHANHAARAMLGAAEPYRRVPWFWSDQYDLGLQIAGLPDPALANIRRDLGDGAFILFQTDEDGRLVSASGIGPGNRVAKDIRLAEMMIERGATPDPESLADPATGLKALLRA